MEFTLEDVGDEFVKQHPFITVTLTDPREELISVRAGGECNVHYIKMLLSAVELVREEMDDDELEELDAWLDSDGD